jgi:carbamoyl-phosphate synthase large subunit
VEEVTPPYFSVKEAVFPFAKFPGVDTILGPEMKSTGEVMGVGESFAEAFVKSQMAAGVKLPAGGKVFISVRNADKPRVVEIGRTLIDLGFDLCATRGTAAYLSERGIAVTAVNKVAEGRPHVVDMIKNGEIDMIVNTTDERRSSIQDSYSIRRSALQARVTYYTTLAGARAACMGMQQMSELRAYSLQGLHARIGSVRRAA